jgi:hypothetical protein
MAHWIVRCHPVDYPVHQEIVVQHLVPGGTVEESHRTVRCIVESSSFSATAIFELGPIYISPNRPFEEVAVQATNQHVL